METVKHYEALKYKVGFNLTDKLFRVKVKVKHNGDIEKTVADKFKNTITCTAKEVTEDEKLLGKWLLEIEKQKQQGGFKWQTPQEVLDDCELDKAKKAWALHTLFNYNTKMCSEALEVSLFNVGRYFRQFKKGERKEFITTQETQQPKETPAEYAVGDYIYVVKNNTNGCTLRAGEVVKVNSVVDNRFVRTDKKPYCGGDILFTDIRKATKEEVLKKRGVFLDGHWVYFKNSIINTGNHLAKLTDIAEAENGLPAKCFDTSGDEYRGQQKYIDRYATEEEIQKYTTEGYKNGDWLFLSGVGNNKDLIMRKTKEVWVSGGMVSWSQYMVNKNSEVHTGHAYPANKVRKATKKEITDYLTELAIIKGFKVGTILNRTGIGGMVGTTEIFPGAETRYFAKRIEGSDLFQYLGRYVYQEGKWATIVRKEGENETPF